MDLITKPTLRKYFKNIRASISQNLAAQKSIAASEYLLNFLSCYKNARIIAVYHPIDTELNIRNAYPLLIEHGYTLALPVVTKDTKTLLFKRFDLNSQLATCSEFEKIFVPPQNHPNVIPDIVIAPLLGCDQCGNRLGYGKGYYDKAIRNLKDEHKKIIYAGICYHEQISQTMLPHNLLDQKLNAVITDQGIMICEI